MYFKTPEILNLLNYIKLQHPMHCEIIDQYIPRFKDIDLSRDIFSLERKELYDHPLTLATNEIVHITWDIDSIIKHAAQHRTEIPFSTVSPDTVLLTETTVFVMLSLPVKKKLKYYSLIPK